MESKEAEPVRVDNNPFEYTMSLIGGKWKLNILFRLWRSEMLRHGKLKRSLGDITHKMLSAKLKELEKDDLVVRIEYPQIPPKVEYRLSAREETIMPILHELCLWGTERIDD